eukprot:jgi/Botrbrau1/7557/Bobra.0159s0007.1
MSLGYAQRLKKQEDYGGTLGDKEIFDSTDILKTKKQKLVDMVKESKYIVAMTGAGISTASGIPDFRGPNGVWTCEKAKKAIAECCLLYGACTTFFNAPSGLQNHGAQLYGPGCRGRLRDSVLDWESPLPEEELQEAEAPPGQRRFGAVPGHQLSHHPRLQPAPSRQEGHPQEGGQGPGSA